MLSNVLSVGSANVLFSGFATVVASLLPSANSTELTSTSVTLCVCPSLSQLLVCNSPVIPTLTPLSNHLPINSACAFQATKSIKSTMAFPSASLNFLSTARVKLHTDLPLGVLLSSGFAVNLPITFTLFVVFIHPFLYILLCYILSVCHSFFVCFFYHIIKRTAFNLPMLVSGIFLVGSWSALNTTILLVFARCDELFVTSPTNLFICLHLFYLTITAHILLSEHPFRLLPHF